MSQPATFPRGRCWQLLARLLVLLGAVVFAGPALAADKNAPSATEALRVVVASKKFPESALLAELYAQLAESRGAVVERRQNLGNSAIVFEALKQGAVDIYPEYSGTALGLVGSAAGEVPKADVRRFVESALADQFALHWGPPLGFNNTYAIAVRGPIAREHGLRTVSDLAALSRKQRVRLAFTHEFLARSDGWSPLKASYDLRGEPRGVEHGIAYQLIENEQIDAMEVYATEGQVTGHDLALLEDDRDFFPPYDAAYLYGPRVANSPRLLAPVLALAGRLDDSTMRGLNRQVEVQGSPIANVARQFLQRQGLLTVAATANHAGSPKPGFDRKRAGFVDLFWQDRGRLLRQLWRHLWLTFLAMLLTVCAGVPLGMLASRSRNWATALIGGTGMLQTLPSLALLVFMVPLFAAIGRATGSSRWIMEGAAVGALFLYGLLPVVRNTKEGLEGVNAATVDAALGLGMTERQVLRHVTLPLALPVVLAGIRTASVIAVGSATLAAFIGAGGLGEPIISGLSVQNFTEVWTGAVPAAGLALGIDGAFALLQRWVAPKTG